MELNVKKLSRIKDVGKTENNEENIADCVWWKSNPCIQMNKQIPDSAEKKCIQPRCELPAVPTWVHRRGCI